MSTLPGLLALEQLGAGRYRAGSGADPSSRGVVYGGQLLAQMILASGEAEREEETGVAKTLSSIHTVFARTASTSEPLEIVLQTFHAGRTASTQRVTVHQGDRRCVGAMVLRQTPEPDLIRHLAARPDVDGPKESEPTAAAGLVAPGTEVRVVGGVDTADPDAPVGPAELFVWLKLPGDETQDEAVSQGLLAYATDGFLIGTAMRPHAGIGQHMAHGSVATGVVTHNLVFHEPVPPGAWLLMAMESSYAGRGRAFGRAQVFGEDGALVSSFSQESIIRG